MSKPQQYHYLPPPPLPQQEELPSTPPRCSPHCSTEGGTRSYWLSGEPEHLRDQLTNHSHH